MSWRCSHAWTTAIASLALFMGMIAVQAEEPLGTDAPPHPASPLSERDLNNRGVQEAQAGHVEQGVILLRQAVDLAPHDAQIRKNLSGVLTDWATQLEQRGLVTEAIAALEEAVQRNADNGQALVRLGDLYYVTQDELSRAIELWKHAHGKLPTAQWQRVAQRISQAERDLRLERAFTGITTDHFRIRFEGTEQTQTIATLGETLEREYARLAKTMNTTIPSGFTVIVYTNERFQRVIGQRDWALGLYDGRIRLRLDDLGTPRNTQILAHELAHAFLAETYGSRIPIWLHEGFAQVHEPAQPLTVRQQKLLDGILTRTQWVPLTWLGRRFIQPSSREDVERAYMEARVVVEFLIERYGAARFQAFLKQLASGVTLEQAFDQGFAPSRWVRVEQGILE